MQRTAFQRVVAGSPEFIKASNNVQNFLQSVYQNSIRRGFASSSDANSWRQKSASAIITKDYNVPPKDSIIGWYNNIFGVSISFFWGFR